MNRQDLVDSVAGKAGLSKAAAGAAVDATFAAIAETLRDGGEVRLMGFGTFAVSERAASEGRNPRTGEKVHIPASKSARLRVGKGLRDELNGGAR
jgi:DNA-binding protein HU-beta